jgi:glycosyltransferase involved in cell wall biosynthesis
MAAGIPTACSDIEPLRSVSDNGALLFDPCDGASIAVALFRLIGDDDLRARLTAAGPFRASAFSWCRTAQETLAALLEAALGSEAA